MKILLEKKKKKKRLGTAAKVNLVRKAEQWEVGTREREGSWLATVSKFLFRVPTKTTTTTSTVNTAS